MAAVKEKGDYLVNFFSWGEEREGIVLNAKSGMLSASCYYYELLAQGRPYLEA